MDLKAFEAILEKNNPKFELSHILIDGDNIVSSDNKMILIKKHNFEVKDKFLVINNKAKFNLVADGLFKGVAINKKFANTYPNYKSFLNFDESEIINYSNGLLKTLYWLGSNKGFIIDYGLLITKLKKLDKMLGKTKKIFFTDKKSLLKIEFENDYVLVMLPLIF